MTFSRRLWLFGTAAAAAGLALPALGGCRKHSDLPELGALEPFALVDQEGRAFGSAELKGHIWVAAFFFTRCPTVCPRLMAAMKGLQAQALERVPKLRFVSFSVDPENDTPPVLKAYAQKIGLKLGPFTLLTGDAAKIQKTSVESFKLALDRDPDAGADHFGIVHGSHFILVDATLHIRGYYASDDQGARTRLLKDAEGLS